MHIPIPALLGLVYGVSEAGLALFKRSRDDSVGADDGSLRVLWVTIVSAVAVGIFASYRLPVASIGGGAMLFWTSIGLFAAGLALRWYAIVYLGRFFTVNVAIHSGHEIVDTGPYRLIRHPSYSGGIAAFTGLALTMDNWVSLALILVPILAAFSHRISIEERALANALGRPYAQYMERTKRLVPWAY